MRSIISSFGQIIDCRQLILSISYYSLPINSAHALTNEFYSFVNTLLPDFVLDWKLQNRSFKDLSEAMQTRSLINGHFSMDLLGSLRSKVVYNKTTFRKYIHEMLYPSIPYHLKGEDASVDYSPYSRERGSTIWIPEQEKDSALKLFDLEGKKYLAESVGPDVGGGGENSPMGLGEPESYGDNYLLLCEKDLPQGFDDPLYHGEYHIGIPIYCLEDQVNQTAELFLEFCLELQKTFRNVNAYVELNPHAECYTRYFGRYPEEGPAAKLPYRGIARSLFFPEFGWGNVISPGTRTFGVRTIDAETIQTEETSSGGLCLRCKKPIMETTIADLKSIKKSMYDVILPRSSTYEGIWDFRKEWEFVPLFEDEVTAFMTGITFEHHGQIDFEKFCRVLSGRI